MNRGLFTNVKTQPHISCSMIEGGTRMWMINLVRSFRLCFTPCAETFVFDRPIKLLTWQYASAKNKWSNIEINRMTRWIKLDLLGSVRGTYSIRRVVSNLTIDQSIQWRLQSHLSYSNTIKFFASAITFIVDSVNFSRTSSKAFRFPNWNFFWRKKIFLHPTRLEQSSSMWINNTITRPTHAFLNKWFNFLYPIIKISFLHKTKKIKPILDFP